MGHPRAVGLGFRAGWAAAVVLGMAAVGCGGDTTDPVGTPKASRSVVFVGFDANPELNEALQAGEIQGLVLQNPLLMGQLGVKTLISHLEGKPYEKKVSTGEAVATPEGMTDPAIKALLNPPKAAHESSAGGSEAAKKYRVMVIPKGVSHEFWKTIHAGALKAAEELGNVEVLWQGPAVQDNVNEQINLIRSAVAKKVSGIILAPADSKILVEPVEEAIAAGVPVVIIDSALESDKITAYVATDNYHGGVLAAQRLGELMKGEGRLVLLRYPPGSAATREREKGFEDTIAGSFPKITYLSKDQNSGPDAAAARERSQSLVARFRDRIDGVFCPNESSTQGMLGALREAGLVGSP